MRLIRPMATAGLVLLLALAAAARDRSDPYDHPPIRNTGGKWTVRSEAGPIGDLTTFCVACHEGLNRPADPQGSHTGTHSHPVDVSYPGEGAGLVPLSDLDKRLVLVDGAVTCITCHDPTAPDHRLVIERGGSELCVACHRK